MKAADYLKQLRGKNAAQLDEELAALRKEQFKLRMQAATGQQAKSHIAGDVRRKIARIQTVLKQQSPQPQAKAS